MHIRIIISCLIAILLTGQAAAEDRLLGLRQAVSQALENNRELRAFTNSVAARKEDVGIARSYLLPRISLEERFMRTTNPTYAFMAKLNQERFGQEDFAIPSLNSPSAINDFQTSLSFEQAVFVKKAHVGLDMAKTELSAKTEDFRRMREDVALRVGRTYLMTVTARAFVTITEKALEDALEHRRIADVRSANGLGLYSDTLRAATAVTEAEQRVVTARKNFDVARRALSLLLATDDAITPDDRGLDLPVLAFDHYSGQALARKDLKSLALRVENARNGQRLADAAFFPTVGVGGSYQLNDHRAPFGAEGQSWQFMAFLRWDLFDGTRRGHERTKARLQTAEAEENLQAYRQAVSFKVYEAYKNTEEAKKNAELAQSALKTAEEGRRLVKVRYENSLSPLVDLLDAQTSLDHARASVLARENEHAIAVLTLGYESGTILKDLGLED